MRFWTRIAKASYYAAIVITAAAGVLAVTAPNDILSASPTLRAFCDAMFHTSAPIRGYTKQSQFPEVTLCYMTLTLLLSPLYFFAAFYAMRTKAGEVFVPIDQMERRAGSTVGDAITGAGLITALCVPLVYFMVVINPGIQGFSFMNISESRISLALFGWIFSGGVFLLAGFGCLTIIRGWIWFKQQFGE